MLDSLYQYVATRTTGEMIGLAIGVVITVIMLLALAEMIAKGKIKYWL